MSSSNTNINDNDVAVIACGYRYIRSLKTGLMFPAWLIAFSNKSTATSQENHKVDSKDDSMDAPSSPCPRPLLLYWRSKKDFLRLSRAFRNITFPKAAMKKLAEQSPWKHPDWERIKSVMMKCDSYNNRDVTATNKYQRDMKKSLWQLDQFLKSVYQRTIVDSNNDELLTAWKEFSRSHDTDDLVPLILSSKTTVPSITMTTPEGEPKNQSQQDKQQSSLLGQYFSSLENSQQLVQLLLERMKLLAPSNQKNEREKWLLIEPSCGYGQLIISFLEELFDTKSYSMEGITRCVHLTILAIDIDPEAVEECKRRLDESRQREPSIDHIDIQFSCHNFLTTRYDEYLSTLLQPSISSTSSINNGNSNYYNEVFFIGGPPYSSGAGSKNGGPLDIGHPLRFVQHSINEYHANSIIFLMPARYEKIMIKNQHEHEQGNDCIIMNYACQTHQLIAPSKFLFQGKDEVVQPSIIQVFTKPA